MEGSLKRLKTDVIDLYYQHRVDSSVAVHKVTPTAAVYAATKHYVWALSEGLRQEVKPYDIRTTVISPGAVATELPNSISEPDVPESMHKYYEAFAIPRRGVRAGSHFRPEPARGGGRGLKQADGTRLSPCS